jgi:hypothetical protein
MGRLLKGRGSQKTCLVRLPGSETLEKYSFLPRDEMGKKEYLAMVSLCERQRPGNTYQRVK